MRCQRQQEASPETPQNLKSFANAELVPSRGVMLVRRKRLAAASSLFLLPESFATARACAPRGEKRLASVTECRAPYRPRHIEAPSLVKSKRLAFKLLLHSCSASLRAARPISSSAKMVVGAAVSSPPSARAASPTSRLRASTLLSNRRTKQERVCGDREQCPAD